MLTANEIIIRDKDKPKNEKLYTGIAQIDNGILANTMRRGHNILTMAESGHGKTQMSLFLAERLLLNGYKVAWFQLEGYDIQTAQHFENVTPDLLDNVLISDKIHDVDDIVAQARIAKREHGIDFLVVDYIQNVEMQGKETKIEKTERISRTLTKLTIELNTVLNVCSQITIDTSTRKLWALEPRENDVRWSRQMKQDADAILGIFRPSSVDGLYDIVDGESISKDWKGEKIPYNSVFARIVKDRHGERNNKRLHMIHTEDKGLKIYDRVWGAIEQPQQPNHDLP
jgi:replicative DNA helicase